MDEKFDEDGLKSLLASEITSAINYEASEMSAKRARALEYYRGIMSDTPAAVGRSSIVSRDVADTIGWMLPGIIRVFTASDQMAIYEPEKQSDEPFAKQATDYVNYVFFREKENNGYRVLWEATHDSLLLGNGIVKHWWDKKEECEYSEHSGLTLEQIAILESDEDAEVIAKKEGAPQVIMVPNGMGGMMQMPIQTFDVKVKRVLRNGRLKVKCIKKLLLNREATCIEDARFLSHPEDVSRSDLIAMGFDRDLVDNLPIDRYSTLREEDIARNDNTLLLNGVGDNSMSLVELHECYVKVDVNDDGIAETVRAFYAGGPGTGELLDWEVWEDDVPFSDIPCEPVPHQWEARSIFDDVEDIQRVKTVLTRQFLDNTYWVNNPMTAAEESSVTNPETLRSPRFGATVWVKKGTTLPPTPLAVPYIGDKALLALQHFDQVREMRTGVSRSTMALDPEALQNQTATAANNQKDAAYSQVELVARNQAELGWRRVFQQILKLIVKHQDRPRTIRLRDTWVEMDPKVWNANMDVTINIGLGTGSRDRDMAMMNTVLSGQIAMTDRLAQAGFAEQALDMLPKVNTSLIKLTEASGVKNPDQFFLDIKPETLAQMKQAAAQPKPSPEEIKGQVQMAIADKQAQLDQQADDRRAQIEAVQAQADIATQDKKNANEAMLKQQDFELKKELAVMQFQFDRELKLMEEARKQSEFDQKMAFERERHQQAMQAGAFKSMQAQEAHEQKMEAVSAKSEAE